MTSTFVPKGLSAPALGLYTCIKALKYIPGPGVHLQDHWSMVYSNIFLSIADPKVPKSFDAVFVPIEESIVPMNYAFNTIQMLSSTTWSDRSMKAFERVSEVP